MSADTKAIWVSHRSADGGLLGRACSFCDERKPRLVGRNNILVCADCIEAVYEITNEWGTEEARAVMERRNAERAAGLIVKENDPNG